MITTTNIWRKKCPQTDTNKTNEYHPCEEYIYENMFSVHAMLLTFKSSDKCNQTIKDLELPINCYILEHKHIF